MQVRAAFVRGGFEVIGSQETRALLREGFISRLQLLLLHLYCLFICFLNVNNEDNSQSVHPVSRLVHWWSAAGRMKFNFKKTLFNLMWAQSSETFMLRDVQSLFVVYKTSQMSRWSDFTFLSSWFLLMLHLRFPPS